MKNPWLSMWLSAANAAAGATRGFWTAEFHRQQRALARETARAMTGEAARPARRRPSKRQPKKG